MFRFFNNLPQNLLRLGSSSTLLAYSLAACLLLVAPLAQATHIRAGEITAVRLGSDASLRYRFTLTVYTDDNSTVENTTATINFGDGTQATVGRSARIPIPASSTTINQYQAEHSYPGPGSYTAFYTEQNRNLRVLNMTNSGQTNFYVETRLTIDPLLGVNNSPLLLSPPIDQGALRRVYRHNPAAYDPDGDSLSFELTQSRQFINGVGPQVVAGFQYPDAFAGGRDSANVNPASLRINPRTGQLTWDVPNAFVGEYNVAVRINEWRKNRFNRMVQIGYVIRDMQILITDSPNNPPVLELPRDTCFVAGTNIQGEIIGRDRDASNQQVIITGSGGPFALSSPSNNATLTVVLQERNRTISQFSWRTTCADVRTQPYIAVFKATEVSPLTPPLTDLRPWLLRVYGPRPTGLRAVATGAAAQLNWNNYQTFQCSNADSIIIYRREERAVTDSMGCQPGMNPSTGYVRIASVLAGQSQYLDDNNGRGLRQNVVYSYRLVARYPAPEGGLSYPSADATVRLKLALPTLKNVSVERTGAATGTSTGQVFVRWTKPLEPDTVQYKLPYQYVLQRWVNGGYIDVFTTNNWERDTTYLEEPVSTLGDRQTYRLQFGFMRQTNVGMVRAYETAAEGTTPLLTTASGNRTINLLWQSRTPWQNFSQPRTVNNITYPYHHLVQREINGVFTTIDSVVVGFEQGTYTDAGTFGGQPLVLGQTYKYRILTRGGYSIRELPPFVENWSQIAEGVPIDTTKPNEPGDTTDPCNPDPTNLPRLLVKGCNDCPSLLDPANRYNELRWGFNPSTNPCDSAIVRYNIYFTPRQGGAYTRIANVPADTGIFRHSDRGSLAGCYYLTAVNRFGVESRPGQVFCTDNCPLFRLPNVITPDPRDGINDNFGPICSIPEFVEQVETRIYNRYGVEVHNTTDPGINWTGTQQLEGGRKVPAGTYFYYVRVRFKRLVDAPEEVYRGWVEVVY